MHNNSINYCPIKNLQDKIKLNEIFNQSLYQILIEGGDCEEALQDNAHYYQLKDGLMEDEGLPAPARLRRAIRRNDSFNNRLRERLKEMQELTNSASIRSHTEPTVKLSPRAMQLWDRFAFNQSSRLGGRLCEFARVEYFNSVAEQVAKGHLNIGSVVPILEEMAASEEPNARTVMSKLGLSQGTENAWDTASDAVEDIFSLKTEAFRRCKNGDKKAFGVLMSAVMKYKKGLNPLAVRDSIENKLKILVR